MKRAMQIASVLCISNFWVLVLLILIENRLLDARPFDHSEEPLLQFTALMVAAAFAFILTALSKHRSIDKRRLLAKDPFRDTSIGLACFAISLFLNGLASLANPFASIAAYLAWGLLGTTATLFCAACFRPLTQLDPLSRPISVGVALVLGSCSYYLVNTLGFMNGAFLVILLILGSLWGLYPYRNAEIHAVEDDENVLLSTKNITDSKSAHQPSYPTSATSGSDSTSKTPGPFSSNEEPTTPFSFKAAVFIYTLVFGYMAFQMEPIETISWISISAAALTVPPLIFSLESRDSKRMIKHIRSGMLQRTVAAVVIFGMLLLAFVGTEARLICCTIIAAAFAYYSCTDITSRLFLETASGSNPFHAAIEHQGVTFLGLACGIIMGLLTTVLNSIYSEQLVTVSALLLSTFLVAAIAITPSPYIETHPPVSESPSSPTDSERLACAIAAIVEEFGLTKREAEVFALMVKRESTRSIQEKLVISPHTVESHVHNIYRKIDLGSRDEVVALLETRMESLDTGCRVNDSRT